MYPFKKDVNSENPVVIILDFPRETVRNYNSSFLLTIYNELSLYTVQLFFCSLNFQFQFSESFQFSNKL